MNVIVINLAIVGKNGTDVVNCEDSVSDGTDGNFDVTNGADCITVSWTKFFYSGRRAGGHKFSNLIGGKDNNAKDEGHLRLVEQDPPTWR